MSRRAAPRSASFPAHRVAGYLARRTRFGIKFGLETMQALVAEMGHPERAYRSILIAGTNGKGSVAAYCDSVLRGAGLLCGRYTSPHLVRLNERITVGGREIGERALARAVAAVREAATRLVRRGVLRAHPTFFEVLTAAAFEHFRERRVELAVLEVGLGGRLDATNVADPLVSAIVSVERDHEAYLGTTLRAIASEKAGVMRRDRPTVVGPCGAEARDALRACARAAGARLVEAPAGARFGDGLAGRLDLTTPRARYVELAPLPGRHQRDNLLVAVRLLEELAAAGVAVDPARVVPAVAATRWPGRLEAIAGRPPLLLDGAHNPAGALALRAHLRGGPPFVLLFAAMADKDVLGIAKALFPLASAIVLTRPRISRAATPDEIARRTGALGRAALREPSVARALARARRLALALGRGTRVVVAGSLYLVGAVKALRRPARVARARSARRPAGRGSG